MAALMGASHAGVAGEVAPPGPLRFVDRFREIVKGVSLCVEEGDSCRPVATATEGAIDLPLDLRKQKVVATAEGFRPRVVLPHEQEVALIGTGVISVRLELMSRDETDVDLLLIRQGSTPGIRESRHLAARAPRTVRFSDLPPGSYRLTATGPQLVEETKTIGLAPSRQVDIGSLFVRRGRLISGMILEAAGLPISGAVVELLPEDGGAGLRFRAETKDDGLFSFAGVPWETAYAWTIRATGWRLESGRLGGEDQLYVTMTPASRIIGRVMGESTPIAGAEVTVTYVVRESPRETAGDPEAETDEDGGFTIWRSRDGKAQLEVRAAGFRPARRRLEDRGASTPPRDEDVGDIELTRGRTIEGVVRQKRDGTPLAGVAVLAATPIEPEAAMGSTDSDGRFVLEGLPEKGRLTIVASLVGFAKAVRDIADSENHVEIALSLGVRVEGRVCASAKELAETRLSLSPAGFSRYQGEPTEPESSGRFVFEDLEPGGWLLGRTWRVATGPQSYTTVGTSTYRTLTVPDGGLSGITIGCEGLPVSGRLMSNGAPVRESYAELSIEGQAVSPFRSDEVGHFVTKVPSAGLFGAVVTFPMIGSGKKSTECYVPPGGTTECNVDVGR
ncbi:MAG TPA: carboxypeptidase-like regulatory domain-containing protein [Thermoanaerobaculia bacterium]|nr:carboxypeptidase-like regulatory domain-containing protein [Thermoanaerobaculia bacterium]